MASSNVPHPSPRHLLPTKLWFNETDSNYREWKASAIYLIQCQGLIGYIDGSYSGSMDHPGYDAWKKIDQPLKQGILSLLEKDVADAVKDLDTSRLVWLKLETTMFIRMYNRDGTTNTAQLRAGGDWNYTLYRAVVKCDWTATKQIINTDNGAIGAKLNSTQATALHIAVEGSIGFLTKLVDAVVLLPNSSELLAAKDAIGNTALNTAAAVGNESAAAILVSKNPDLVYTPNILGDFPIHTAAKHAKRNTLVYLISVTSDDRVHADEKPYEGFSGLALLISTIQADFFDIALYLVKKYPELARLKLSSNSALESIAGKEFTFEDGKLYIPSYTKDIALTEPDAIGDIVTILNIEVHPVSGKMFREHVGLLVGDIVKRLCAEIKRLSDIEAEYIYRDAILIAAKLGNAEVIEHVIEVFPDSIYCSNPVSFQNIFHVAVENRAGRVFSLIRRIGEHRHLYVDIPDINGNTPLHLAAKLSPPHKLAAIPYLVLQIRFEKLWYKPHTFPGIPNPVLQMRLEMLWYKEVEKYVHPHCREQLNYAGKSPWTILLEEHKKLKEVGERWAKDTANSCTVSSALIATISFAAAITVPGGYEYDRDNAFWLFYVMPIVISMIGSVISLICFLDISTSGYVEEDFIIRIPKRLFWGLYCLVNSIGYMMCAFIASIIILSGHKGFSNASGIFLYITTVLMLAAQFPIVKTLSGFGNATDKHIGRQLM